MNHFVGTLPKAIVVCLGLMCSGCASTSFSRYQGQQIAWPTAQGSLVEPKNHGVEIIHGLPSKPYAVIGFVEGSGMERKNIFGGKSIWSPDVLGAVAKVAKKNRAEAIVLLGSEREFAGFFNYQSSYTSPMYAFGTANTIGPYSTVNMQLSGATTTGWGYSTPMYERRFSAIAIRFIGKYPEPTFLVNGQQMTGEELREYFYTKHPELKGRELLAAAIMPWVRWPQSGALDDGLQSVATQASESLKRESQDDMSGTWYGYVTQTSQLANGTSATGSSHVRVTFTQSHDRAVGNGNLDSGEAISLEGDIEGAKISGSVINTTSGLQSTFRGTATSQQITGEFSGAGSGQTVKGVFTLYR